MIISNRVSMHRVIQGTWRHLMFNIILCCLTYFLSHLLFPSGIQISALAPGILGTALAFFIGFNNNQAYDRWWEARKIWGSLVNDSRTWARQVVFFQNKNKKGAADTTYAETAINRHIAFLYALKQNLRRSDKNEYQNYISDDDLAYISTHSNKANALLTLQTRDLNELYESGAIDGFLFLELNKILIRFCDHMGKSERIANTVFPTTYNYYTRMFIYLFITFETFVSAQELGVWSIFIGVLIGYIFLTVHKIGLSLLNPFEEIPSGIPLNQIARTIEINMLQTLKKTDLPEPVESINGEYVM